MLIAAIKVTDFSGFNDFIEIFFVYSFATSGLPSPGILKFTFVASAPPLFVIINLWVFPKSSNSTSMYAFDVSGHL